MREAGRSGGAGGPGSAVFRRSLMMRLHLPGSKIASHLAMVRGLWKLWETRVQCSKLWLQQPFDRRLPEGVAELRAEEAEMSDRAAGLFG